MNHIHPQEWVNIVVAYEPVWAYNQEFISGQESAEPHMSTVPADKWDSNVCNGEIQLQHK